MRSVALRAHYDGTHVVLDEPHDLAPNASLLVTVLDSGVAPAPDLESEADWLRVASTSEAFAFLANPAEDIYSVTDGEPFDADAP